MGEQPFLGLKRETSWDGNGLYRRRVQPLEISPAEAVAPCQGPHAIRRYAELPPGSVEGSARPAGVAGSAGTRPHHAIARF